MSWVIFLLLVEKFFRTGSRRSVGTRGVFFFFFWICANNNTNFLKLSFIDCYDSSGSDLSTVKQNKQRKRTSLLSHSHNNGIGRRRKTGLSARERNLRRLESNERERMRMHSLNDAFEVGIWLDFSI